MRRATPNPRRGWQTGLAATLTAGLVASGLALGVPLTAHAAPAAPVSTLKFSTPAGTAWQVPLGVTELSMTLAGAHGAAAGAEWESVGGSGSTVSLTVPVAPGDRVVAYGSTGGGGKNAHTAGTGFRNGGTGGNKSQLSTRGAGGGGASAVTINGEVVAVAAGGGGAGGTSLKKSSNDSHYGADPVITRLSGGDGGNANTHGDPGAGKHPGSSGTSGAISAGSGGNGHSAATATGGAGGGGGGGGWASGSGGGAGRKFGAFSSGGGGGGGTNFTAASASAVRITDWPIGATAGTVTLSYSAASTTELLLPESASSTAAITATVSASTPGTGTHAVAAEGSISLSTADGRLLGEALLNAGTGQIPISGLGEGVHTLRATFTPADGSAPSHDEESITIVAPAAPDLGSGTELSATSTALTLPTAAVSFGVPFTVDVSVTPTPAAALAGSEVRVIVNGIPAASGTMNAAGTAQVTVPAVLPAGTHTIQASFRGTADAAPSTSAAQQLVIAAAGTAATLALSSSSLVHGEPVNATVAVTPLPGVSGTPSGLVLLSDGSELLAMSALDADGSAEFAGVILPLDTTQLFAVYGGDDDFDDVVSAPIGVAVAPAGTSTALSASPATASAGTLTMLEAVVTSGAPSLADPQGSVEFAVDGEVFVVMAVGDDADETRSNGVARFTLPTSDLPAGVHELTARFIAGAGFTDSASAPLAFDHAATQTVTTASAGEPGGGSVAITASVAAAGSPLAAGTLQAFIGDTAVGEPVEAGTEPSVLALTGLDAGSHTVRVLYTPEDDRFLGSETSVSVLIAAADGPATPGTPTPGATVPGTPSADTAALAKTGAEASAWPLGALALLLGAAVVLAARRRSAA